MALDANQRKQSEMQKKLTANKDSLYAKIKMETSSSSDYAYGTQKYRQEQDKAQQNKNRNWQPSRR